MLFVSSESNLLGLLRRFFEICRERNLIVSLPNSNFYLSEIM